MAVSYAPSEEGGRPVCEGGGVTREEMGDIASDIGIVGSNLGSNTAACSTVGSHTVTNAAGVYSSMGSSKWRTHMHTHTHTNTHAHTNVRWSPWTLEVLKKLRTAALQQLLQQQNPDIAKQRVLHTPLLQVHVRV